MGFPSGVASLEREALDPYQSFITGGAAVATLEGGFSMPGNRELTPSASCPNWPNIRDLLTSADDLCSGNARGEPGFELEEPSAIDMRSIGISNKKLFPLGSTYLPPQLAVRGLVRRWAASKRRRGVLPPSRRDTKRTPNLLWTFTTRNRGRILIAAAISAFGAHTHRTLPASNRAFLMRLTLWPYAAVCIQCLPTVACTAARHLG